MPKYSTAFGMDVHLEVDHRLRPRRGHRRGRDEEVPRQPLGRDAGSMDGFPRAVAHGLRSGYLGFAPQRELAGLGVVVVAAVSKIPRSAADSASKNDRTNAARMAKAILAHDISPVWAPSPEVEGIRDLAGAYDGATARLATAKQRLLAFLAKRGFVYGGTTPAGNPRKYWTYDFLRWLDKVRPEDDGGVRTLAALRNEVEAAAEARADLLSEYRAAVDASPIAAEVAALQSIKGCAFALAAAFSAEVGDFTRFRSGRQVTAYFGLAPSQRSSGDSVRLGGISGAGNALVRKLAVEGSWCYAAARHQPKLMPRDTGVPLEIKYGGRGPSGSCGGARRCSPRHARGEGQRGHRGRARWWLWALGMMPGGRGIDMAPVPASRAAFGDTPYFAVRAEPSACASTDLGNPAEGMECGPAERYPRI